MYAIEKKAGRINLTFSGFLKKDEAEKWLREFKKVVDGFAGGPFTVKIDLAQAKPHPPETTAIMVSGQEYARAHGLTRTACIAPNPIMQMQGNRMARETGLQEKYFLTDEEAERYLSG
ncbi:MAG TPA: hypothetical protein GX513_13410 [Firmicutes bacterium]|nr:hypothetical protein [Bacillota bacterium]